MEQELLKRTMRQSLAEAQRCSAVLEELRTQGRPQNDTDYQRYIERCVELRISWAEAIKTYLDAFRKLYMQGEDVRHKTQDLRHKT